MDFAKAFSFVFEDPDWIKKIAIGGIVLLVLSPIFGLGVFMALGYALAVARNVIRGDEKPLPEWSDFGQMLIDGLFTWVIGMVYALPMLIVACIVMFLAMLIGGEDSVLGALGGCCVAVFSVIYGFAMGWFLLPAAVARYAATGEIMSAFQFGEILALTRANFMLFLMALLVAIVANFIGGLGAIACIVGAMFTTFYSYCVTAHAYGQAYLIASEEVV